MHQVQSSRLGASRRGTFMSARTAGLVACAVAASAAISSAATVNWLGGPGNFNDPSKWDIGGVPIAGDVAVITDAFGAGTVNILPGDAFTVLEFVVGNGAGDIAGGASYTGSGAVAQSGGIVNATDWFTIGRFPSYDYGGTYNMTGGTINKSGGGLFVITFFEAAASSMTMSNDATVNVTAGDTRIGAGPRGGTLTMNDTAQFNTINTEFKVGDGFTGPGGAQQSNVGTLVMNGASKVTSNRTVFFGIYGGEGTVTMNGTSSFVKTGTGQFAIVDSFNRAEASTEGSLTLNDSSTLDISQSADEGLNGELWVGQGTNGTGVLTLNDNSVVTARRWVQIGRDGGTGTVNINENATFIHDQTDTYFIVGLGFGATGNGTVNQTGGTLDIRTGRTHVGDNNAVGAYNFSGGVAHFGDFLAIGAFGAGVGTYTQTGGAGDTDIFVVASNSTATNNATISGGSLEARNEMSIGVSGSGTGTVSVTGTGVLRLTNAASGIFVGDQTTGTLNISAGGRVESAGYTIVGARNASESTPDTTPPVVVTTGTGTINLGTGGTLATTSLRKGLGNATVNFNGGTLQAVANETDFVRGFAAGDLVASAQHAVIDSNGFNVTSSANISGVGGLTKRGAGTLELTAVQSYSGRTRIEAGTLRTNATTGVSRVTALEFAGTAAAPVGQLDIAGKPLVIDHNGTSDLNAIRQAAAAGAITSAGLAAREAVGYAEASSLAAVPDIFGTVDSTSTLLRLTLKGDTNLSGNVNFADLVSLAQSYNQGNRFWVNGDSNYDGTVNFADLVLLAQNYNQSITPAQASELGSSFAAEFALAQTVVPEPATLGLLAGIGGLLVTRRRTQR